MTIFIRSPWLWRVLFSKYKLGVRISSVGIELLGGGASSAWEDGLEFSIRSGLLGELWVKGGAWPKAEQLAHVWPWEVGRLTAEISGLQAQGLRALLGRVKVEAKAHHAAFQEQAGRIYIPNHMAEPWIQSARRLLPIFPFIAQPWVDEESRAFLPQIREIAMRGRVVVDEANADFVARETKRLAQLNEYRHLTQEQLDAVVTLEDSTLIVASAGSGKTRVIEHRTRYLVEHLGVPQHEVLVIAYNRHVAEEVRGRLKKVGLDSVVVKTFHAMGLDILGQIEDRPVSLSDLADPDSPVVLYKFISEVLDRLLNDPNNRAALTMLTTYLQPPLDESGLMHMSPAERKQHQQKILAPLGMKGKRVKSYGEFLIAESLYLNQVEFQYEGQYPFVKTRYQPDFTVLRSKGASPRDFIEYFGTDRSGNTRADIDRRVYGEGIQWKKKTHQKCRTNLIDLYYYNMQEGGPEGLCRLLSDRLQASGFQLRTRPRTEVLEEARVDRFPKLVELLVTFLRLFKGSRLSINELEARAAGATDATIVHHRNMTFLNLFRSVLDTYEDALHSRGDIDFEDMISRSIQGIEAGHWNVPFRHILVDEFQDISPLRAHFIRTLQTCGKTTSVLAVGDDFQSIYRFSGSQIRIMTEFGKEFGFFKRRDLTLTHRFSSELAEASNQFILRNPNQIRKTVRGKFTTGKKPISLHFSDGPSPAKTVEMILSRIQDEVDSEAGRVDVLLLGRYRSDEPINLKALSNTYSRIALRFSTIHKAKGAEADFVILLNLNGGVKGFPTGIQDDPLMNLILGGSDPHPYAEERRLFYVALTRARRKTFLIASADSVSEFASEIQSESYERWVEKPPEPEEAASWLCPRCNKGKLILRKGPHGPFYGCSNFPFCKGTRNLQDVEPSLVPDPPNSARSSSPPFPTPKTYVADRTLGSIPLTPQEERVQGARVSPPRQTQPAAKHVAPTGNHRGRPVIKPQIPSIPLAKTASARPTKPIPLTPLLLEACVGDKVNHRQLGPGTIKAIRSTVFEVRFHAAKVTQELDRRYCQWNSSGTYIVDTDQPIRASESTVPSPVPRSEEKTFESCPTCGGTGGIKESYGSKESGYCATCSGKGWVD